MYIIILNYKVDLTEVNRHLEAHRAYLDQNYAKGAFVASGPQNPRTGGVILCNAVSRDEVEDIIATDPFNINEVADYSIIEFSPTKYASGFEKYI